MGSITNVTEDLSEDLKDHRQQPGVIQDSVCDTNTAINEKLYSLQRAQNENVI